MDDTTPPESLADCLRDCGACNGTGENFGKKCPKCEGAGEYIDVRKRHQFKMAHDEDATTEEASLPNQFGDVATVGEIRDICEAVIDEYSGDVEVTIQRENGRCVPPSPVLTPPNGVDPFDNGTLTLKELTTK